MLLHANGVKKKQEALLTYLKKMTSSITQDDPYKEQLLKFQIEVEQKYSKSKHNHFYKFPYEQLSNSSDSSLNDIKNVTTYDLKQTINKNGSNSKLLQSSKDIIDKSKSLIKLINQRYKTETDENKLQEKSFHNSMNKSFSKNYSIIPSRKREFNNDRSPLQNNISLQSRKSNNNQINGKSYQIQFEQNKSYNTSLNYSINKQSQTKGKISNYYISKLAQQKIEMMKLQNNSPFQYNSLQTQDSKLSFKQFFSQKSPQNNTSKNTESFLNGYNSTANLKSKLAQICSREPLRLLK